MMQAVLHQFPGAQATYRFHCRTPGVDLRPYADQIREEIEALCQLSFAEGELDYLGALRFMKSDFIDFLRLFRLRSDGFCIDASGEQLEIEFSGPWLHKILFEVPVMAIINEIYMGAQADATTLDEGRRRLNAKIDFVKRQPLADHFHFSDFGTRRRYSGAWQDEVVGRLAWALPEQLTGTSNVALARKHGLTPIGTMAHEWLQAAQALGPRLVDSQAFALDSWVKEYRGDLGIALTDVIGIDAFVRDFDLYFAKLYDGVRHDSGCPFEWSEKMLAHYRAQGIDPRTKQLVYSDGLTFKSAFRLLERYSEQAKTPFGIGTHLTNDLGIKPISIVIKMIECNGQPVAKLSDSPGKTMCRDQSYLSYLRKVFGLPVEEQRIVLVRHPKGRTKIDRYSVIAKPSDDITVEIRHYPDDPADVPQNWLSEDAGGEQYVMIEKPWVDG